MDCPFCQLTPAQLVFSGPLVVAIRDGFPVSPGHTLVIPRRHVASWFEATPREQAAIQQAIAQLKAELDAELAPDGYNVGFNAGAAAGQTVMHLHVHLIPRFHGDVDDPAGGVRFVIPALGNYRAPGTIPWASGAPPPWVKPGGIGQRLVTGGDADPFVRHLRPLLREARRADIVAAFVQDSGVDLLDDAIHRALERGVHLRVLTGDYLHITQSHALQRLLDWVQAADSVEEPTGSFEVRVVETERIRRSFHPKSWRIETDTTGAAWVGSSNWSRMALQRGVEWNLRVDRERDPGAWAELTAAFDELWSAATVLSAAWLEDYAARADTGGSLPLGDGDDIEVAAPPRPLGVQPRALAALDEARAQGRRRALVVMATGLGKTFLAAFDVQALAVELGRTPRLLFIAHRRELLLQARASFRQVFPGVSMGLFLGRADELDATFVFASVQKLALAEHLARLDPSAFDYVIVDESHHAPAASYRRVLQALEPRFLLGLTATPERADQADVAGLFDDHIVFRADLGEGIEVGRLVPFDYAGLPDTIDFAPIPWRRYTIEQLADLAETQARMERLWASWQRFGGTRTLVFCVSIRHADYVAAWLREKGVRIVAVHTGERSADRETALEDLAAGALDAVAAVDLFNEGIDVPLIDRVVMLRPTASPVVFLQQLGRGLRIAEGKERLQVIDFIGNHKIFLEKVRTLLSLSSTAPSLRSFLAGGSGELELPQGCRVNVDLEVVEMLRKFLPSGSTNETVRLYRELRDAREQRPQAGELVRRGCNPRSIKSGWFAFVAEEGDLDDTEAAAHAHGRAWLHHLERTAMSKSYKMVSLNVLLDADALFAGMALETLAARCHDALSRDPTLRSDIAAVDAFAKGPTSAAWRAYWRKNPVHYWSKGDWFTVAEGRFHFTLRAPEDPAVRAALEELTRELVDMRLATYRRRGGGVADGASSFTCRVIHNQRHPILKLPDAQRDQLPRGFTDVRLDDGRVWQFNFVKIACNVARPVGQRANQLPDLLYRWFGPQAGRPGTDFQVRFRRSPESWWAEPLGQVITLPQRGEVVSFPTLRAAAGAAGDAQSLVEAQTVRLPHGGEQRFAVRASGDSMDGGRQPIRDGDWVVLQWARGASLPAVDGRVCLVARGDVDVGQSHHLKRVVRTAEGSVVLRSDNPAAEPLAVTGDTLVLAKLVEVVRPESLAPPEGTVVTDFQAAFGIEEVPRPGISRADGHLFLLVEDRGELSSPEHLPWPVADRASSETAFVLTRTDGTWRYAGVGRWAGKHWVFPAVDFATWRALGEGRGASRALPPKWKAAAERLAEWVAEHHAEGDWLDGRGKRCRYQGRAARGGVRIDHEGMKKPRTVSLMDLGWVLLAWDRRGENGGVLDEAWVNRLRYLEGTPKASTRWIDTGWAMVLRAAAAERGFTSAG